MSITYALPQDTLGFHFVFKEKGKYTELIIHYTNPNKYLIAKTGNYYFQQLSSAGKSITACQDSIVEFTRYPCSLNSKIEAYIDDAALALQRIKPGHKQVLKFKYKLKGNYYYADTIIDPRNRANNFKILIGLNQDNRRVLIFK